MATSAEFWENSFYGPGDSNNVYELQNGRSPSRSQLMRILRKPSMKRYGEILSTLLEDSTPASTASLTKAQVDAVADVTDNKQGGVRGVTSNEQMSLTINPDKDDASANTARAVTAADVTAIQSEIISSGARSLTRPSTYPVDLSGNGGGGKIDLGR